MTSAQQQSIPINPSEVPEVQRFLEQMRAQKSMEAGGGSQDIPGIVNEFMKRQLRLIRTRVEDRVFESAMEAKTAVLKILNEHLKALD
jgi:hypothetical protein